MKTIADIVIVAVFAGLVALIIWILAVRSRAPTKDKIAGLLQLVATYTIVLGLLTSSGVFKQLDELLLGLTSPDPFVFLLSNVDAFAYIYLGMSTALDPSTSSSGLRFLLGLPILLVESLFLFAYTVIHFLVIVPITYFAYLATTVPVDAILNSSKDFEITVGTDVIRIKELVRENEAALRNFSVALPAFGTSVVLKVLPLLRRDEKQPN